MNFEYMVSTKINLIQKHVKTNLLFNNKPNISKAYLYAYLVPYNHSINVMIIIYNNNPYKMLSINDGSDQSEFHIDHYTNILNPKSPFVK